MTCILSYQSNLWISLASVALFSADRKVALTEEYSHFGDRLVGPICDLRKLRRDLRNVLDEFDGSDLSVSHIGGPLAARYRGRRELRRLRRPSKCIRTSDDVAKLVSLFLSATMPCCCIDRRSGVSTTVTNYPPLPRDVW